MVIKDEKKLCFNFQLKKSISKIKKSAHVYFSVK